MADLSEFDMCDFVDSKAAAQLLIDNSLGCLENENEENEENGENEEKGKRGKGENEENL